MTVRVFRMDAPKDYYPQALAGHRGAVMGAWFSEDMQNVRMIHMEKNGQTIDVYG